MRLASCGTQIGSDGLAPKRAINLNLNDDVVGQGRLFTHHLSGAPEALSCRLWWDGRGSAKTEP